MKYAVVEISGKQYKVLPGKALNVDFLGDIKKFDCDKVLLLADGDKLSFGNPYLKDKLNFEVLENISLPKIRVATYHAKANQRRVKGIKPKASKIKLVV